MNDLRFALRQLRYAPAFTVTALATIAICLGANLAIFAVIDAILLRSLPFPQSDRLFSSVCLALARTRFIFATETRYATLNF